MSRPLVLCARKYCKHNKEGFCTIEVLHIDYYDVHYDDLCGKIKETLSACKNCEIIGDEA